MYCPKCGAIFCAHSVINGTDREHCPACSHVNYKNPYPCVSVIVSRCSGEILLGKRRPGALCPNQWCLPCGYVERGESYADAAARETLEETGVHIRLRGIINVVSNRLSGGVYSLVVVLLAEPENPAEKPAAGDDITDVGWFSPETLPELAFEADKFIIEKYRRLGDDIPLITLEGGCFVADQPKTKED